MKHYWKDSKGIIHLSSACGSDYTLCGIASDDEEYSSPEMELLNKGVVTCPDCIIEIRNCRNVKFKIVQQK